MVERREEQFRSHSWNASPSPLGGARAGVRGATLVMFNVFRHREPDPSPTIPLPSDWRGEGEDRLRFHALKSASIAGPWVCPRGSSPWFSIHRAARPIA